MKVVHVVEDFSLANTGITSAVRQLAEATVARGHQVEIITAGDAPAYGDGKLKVRALPCGAWRYSSAFSSILMSAMKDGHIVHVHGVWMYPQWRAAILANKFSWPLLLSPHNMLGGWLWRRGAVRRVKKRAYFEFLLRKTFCRAVIHALSEAERSVLAREYFPRSRIEKIPNALDVSLYARRSRRLDTGCDRYLLFLGRIHPVKGLPLLLEAFESVARDDASISLKVAGPFYSAAYERAIRVEIEARGLANRVYLLGPVYGDGKDALIEGAWAVCAPSYSEGVSMVALEAMAAGVPVISTVESGIDDLKDGGGLLVSAGDVTALTAAMKQSIAWNADERANRGAAACSLARSRYSWSSVWARYESLYESIAIHPAKIV